jgi:hypothetical protein
VLNQPPVPAGALVSSPEPVNLSCAGAPAPWLPGALFAQPGAWNCASKVAAVSEYLATCSAACMNATSSGETDGSAMVAECNNGTFVVQLGGCSPGTA